ncbi:MAG: phage holin family protein [Ignavibacteria bacterium]|jgi:hypothetical protein|nr:phage holin family protein [Ignavibacteria bacterium]
MNYRIFLMLAGLMMMFAVFSSLIMVGALVGNSDAWKGNFGLASVFTSVGIVLCYVGIKKRRRAYMMFEEEIAHQLSDSGFIEALKFSNAAQVSLDEARDILDKFMKKRFWQRKELSGYNAEYRQNS